MGCGAVEILADANVTEFGLGLLIDTERLMACAVVLDVLVAVEDAVVVAGT